MSNDAFTYFDLITRSDLKAFDQVEAKAKESARRISEIKAFLPINVDDRQLKQALKLADQLKARMAEQSRMQSQASFSAKYGLNTSTGGSNGGGAFGNILSGNAVPVAAAVAIDAAAKGVEGALEGIADAMYDGSDTLAGAAKGLLKNLPVLKQAFGIVAQIERIDDLMDGRIATKAQEETIAEVNAQKKRDKDAKSNARSIARQAESVSDQEDVDAKLRGLTGPALEKAKIQAEAERKLNALGELAVKAQDIGGAEGANALDAIDKASGKVLQGQSAKQDAVDFEAAEDAKQKQRKDIAKELDRAGDVASAFGGLGRKLVRGFLKAADEAAERQVKLADLGEDTKEIGLRAALREQKLTCVDVQQPANAQEKQR